MNKTIDHLDVYWSQNPRAKMKKKVILNIYENIFILVNDGSRCIVIDMMNVAKFQKSIREEPFVNCSWSYKLATHLTVIIEIHNRLVRHTASSENQWSLYSIREYSNARVRALVTAVSNEQQATPRVQYRVSHSSSH